jgi:mono/diheme cytochrome c family protein/uncharacterized membrane protein
VHLPVGILVLAFVLQCIGYKTGAYHKTIVVVLLIGAISAVLSCISGIVLSKHDEYDPSLVNLHQWMGITTTLVCTGAYFLFRNLSLVRWQWPSMIAIIILISLTGHMGGTLTHGADYLSAPLSAGDDGLAGPQKPIANVQEAMVYDSVIQPVLQRKCYSCHNANKRKGGLRMDQPGLLMQGGKNGKIIVGGNATESEMIKRILLPKQEEHHMPPKEKPQLTEKEIALLHWWINTGAAFDKKVKDLPQPATIQPVLAALQQSQETTISLPDIPEEPVEEASAAAIQKLKDKGVIVLPVAQNSHYLMANYVSAHVVSNQDIELLLPLKKQLVWLKLGNTSINDTALTAIGKCTSLTRLQLEHTSITDAGLTKLNNLQQLRYLNLVGTKVTAKGLMALKELKELRSLYVYQTATAAADTATLQKAFPKTRINIGGYVVPILEGDTSRVKYEPKKS